MRKIRRPAVFCLLLSFLLLPFSLTACGKMSGGKSVRDQLETAPIYAVENGITQLRFSTTDIDGQPVSSEDFQDASLIMVNFWEPWCSPCVQEMPELEELYENYRDQGLVILGAYGSENMDDDARSILEDANVTYPILHSNTNMRRFATAYFPTTIFLTGDGELLSEEAFIGANSYDTWAKVVEEYLEEVGDAGV